MTEPFESAIAFEAEATEQAAALAEELLDEISRGPHSWELIRQLATKIVVVADSCC
jgi:hypothetical protein